MSAPRTGTPFVLTSLAIALMFCAAAAGCTGSGPAAVVALRQGPAVA